MEQQFQYYAFINYKRQDEKWAKWLQSKLENDRLPTTLCNANSHLGNYPKARNYHQKTLAILENSVSHEHPDIAMSYSNIDSIYSKQSDYPKALTYYQKAQAIQEKTLGLEHNDTRNTLEAINRIKKNQKYNINLK